MLKLEKKSIVGKILKVINHKYESHSVSSMCKGKSTKSIPKTVGL